MVNNTHIVALDDKRSAFKKNQHHPGLEDIQSWFLKKFRDEFEIDPATIRFDEPFANFGLTSIQAVTLSGDLEEWLDRELSPTLIYEFPTIEALARHLANDVDIVSAAANNESSANSLNEIAIVGIGCQFPGAKGPDAFWNVLWKSTDCISQVPGDRWDCDAYFDNDPDKPGKMNTRYGGFINNVDQFDPQFFGISPKEARQIDPQHRLLLESAWEALEDAGIPIDRLKGSSTGVFIGISSNDYWQIQAVNHEITDSHAGTGNARCIAANRISYSYDLRGPSMTVDTACSSSLVAVRMACQSLISGESCLALAGGVNLLLWPELSVNFSKAGFLAADGKCKAFDERADGYVRSEGVGVVVLKPLAKAIQDGDHIYAKILGGAINQDGRSNGLTAPNQFSQEEVLRAACKNASVKPNQVIYVEAHGTGTALGDPIEVKALNAVLGQNREAVEPLSIGSVKTNIGHLEAAAGIAGLIKVALCLKHRAFPASLHFEHPNPYIPFDQFHLKVQSQPERYTGPAGRLIAGVSSFGFGGTNAHLVLQAHDSHPPLNNHVMVVADKNSHHLLSLSARDNKTLHAVIKSYIPFLQAHQELSPSLLCYNAGVSRVQHDQRIALVFSSVNELSEKLTASLADTLPVFVHSGRRNIQKKLDKLAFVFSGQGTQYIGMGLELMATERVFLEEIQRWDEAISRCVSWRLLDTLKSQSALSDYASTELAQPAIVAVQAALSKLWQSWGIKPQAVIGHSVGEITAAYVSGILSLEQAATIVCNRARLMERFRGKGKMVAVKMPIVDLHRHLSEYQNRVSIAAVNSTASVVISGDTDCLDELIGKFNQSDIFCKELPVSYAFHSAQMDSIQDEFIQSLQGLEPRPAQIPVFSSVTRKPCLGNEFTPAYWARNLRETVNFSGAIQQMAQEGITSFVEISTLPVLTPMILECFENSSEPVTVVPSLKSGLSEREALLNSLGKLYVTGHSINYKEVCSPSVTTKVSLPGYPWQRERIWFNQKHELAVKTSAINKHVILKADSPAQSSTSTDIKLSALPYLNDHRLDGCVVVPAACYVDLALSAVRGLFGEGVFACEDIRFEKLLACMDSQPDMLQLVLEPDDSKKYTFQFYSGSNHHANSHSPAFRNNQLLASGRVFSLSGNLESRRATPMEIATGLGEPILAEEFYAAAASRGIEFGHGFRRISKIWRKGDVALAQANTTELPSGERQRHAIHPTTLDAGFQLLGMLTPETSDTQNVMWIPVAVKSVTLLSQPTGHFWIHARASNRQDADHSIFQGDIALLDDSGKVYCRYEGVQLRQLGARPSRMPSALQQDWLYRLQWHPTGIILDHVANLAQTAAQPFKPDTSLWLVFADDAGVATSFVNSLRSCGRTIITVFRGDGFKLINTDTVQTGFDQTAHLTQLRQWINDTYQKLPDTIIHLWSLDATTAEDSLTLEQLHLTQQKGSEHILLLLQAYLRNHGADSAPRIWLVTQGSQQAGESSHPIAIQQSPLWGLGRVMLREYPDSCGGLIDLDPLVTPHFAGLQLATLFATVANIPQQLALRNAQIFTAKLQHQEDKPGILPVINNEARYLITGGLGALGLCAADWLVKQGARHLILLGRKGLPAKRFWSSLRDDEVGNAARHVTELESQGVAIEIVDMDIADEEKLRKFFSDYSAVSGRAIRGIIHTAGIVADGLLDELKLHTYRQVLRPKMDGAWLLNQLNQDRSLDFFWMFSSVASIIGPVGQGAYAAANSFLDALAHYRNHKGQPALSIGWGLWSGLGLATTAEGQRLQKLLDKMGIDGITPASGFSALESILRGEHSHMVVLPVESGRFASGVDLARDPFLTLLASMPDSRPSRSKILHDLAGLSLEARHRKVVQHLTELAGAVLEMKADDINIEQPLNLMGLDSIMAVELKHRLEWDFEVDIPIVKFLQGPSIRQFTDFILEKLDAPPSLNAKPISAGHENKLPTMQQIENLTDNEVNDLLQQLLLEEEF